MRRGTGGVPLHQVQLRVAQVEALSPKHSVRPVWEQLLRLLLAQVVLGGLIPTTVRVTRAQVGVLLLSALFLLQVEVAGPPVHRLIHPQALAPCTALMGLLAETRSGPPRMEPSLVILFMEALLAAGRAAQLKQLEAFPFCWRWRRWRIWPSLWYAYWSRGRRCAGGRRRRHTEHKH